MAHYEQKLINGNLYWYRRIYIDGRQKSEYIGKKQPQCLESDRKNYEAAQKRETDRRKIEMEIIRLQRQLNNLWAVDIAWLLFDIDK